MPQPMGTSHWVGPAMRGAAGLAPGCTVVWCPCPALIPFLSPFSLSEFFKFKGFESLSSIPRSFTLRRVSVVPSSPESLGMCLPPPQGFLEEAFDSTQDDLNTMPKGPGPYARSSDMYSHMGTMPRLSFGKVGKSLGKARGTQSCREKGSSRDKIPSTAPLPVPKALKMPGTLNLGKDPSSASGKAEQEKEKALPSGSPGAEKTRMDQEIPGNSPCPGVEAPSPSLAPSPSAASGAETTDGDFQEKGQERPSESSPDRYGSTGFALPTLCCLGRTGGWDTAGSPRDAPGQQDSVTLAHCGPSL